METFIKSCEKCRAVFTYADKSDQQIAAEEIVTSVTRGPEWEENEKNPEVWTNYEHNYRPLEKCLNCEGELEELADECCNTCVYMQRNPQLELDQTPFNGTCRFESPRPCEVEMEDGRIFSAMWPPVALTDWCRHYDSRVPTTPGGKQTSPGTTPG